MRHTQAGLLAEASNAVFLFSGCAPNDHEDHSANTATALRGIFTRFPFHPPFGGHLCTLIFTCYLNYGMPGAICQQNNGIGSVFWGGLFGVQLPASLFHIFAATRSRQEHCGINIYFHGLPKC